MKLRRPLKSDVKAMSKKITGRKEKELRVWISEPNCHRPEQRSQYKETHISINGKGQAKHEANCSFQI